MNDLLELFGRLGDDEGDRAVAMSDGDAHRVPDVWRHERDLRECVDGMLDELLETMQVDIGEVAAAGGRDAIFKVYVHRLIARIEERKHEAVMVN